MINDRDDSNITRREFAQKLATGAAAAACACGLVPAFMRFASGDEELFPPREALFFEKLDGGKVKCTLCSHECTIEPGRRGTCRTRENRDGVLHTLVYGRVAGNQTVPVEIGNFFHFLPGSKAYAIGTSSCTLQCKYCPFWKLASETPETINAVVMSPGDVVQQALLNRASVLSFTMNEPTVFYEFMVDTARAAREKGLKVVLRTNGFIKPEPLRELLKVTDGVLGELKGFEDGFYRDICSGSLAPVLETLKACRQSGVAMEIMCIVVPTLNDNIDVIGKMCGWIHENIGDDVPVMFCRFLAAYKLTHLPSTPVKTLEAAVAAARQAGIKYAYVGNVPLHAQSSTYCSKCGKLLVKRIQVVVAECHVVKGKCKFCGEEIPGVWVK